jgi:hypothetical protein
MGRSDQAARMYDEFLRWWAGNDAIANQLTADAESRLEDLR